MYLIRSDAVKWYKGLETPKEKRACNFVLSKIQSQAINSNNLVHDMYNKNEVAKLTKNSNILLPIFNFATYM